MVKVLNIKLGWYDPSNYNNANDALNSRALYGTGLHVPESMSRLEDLVDASNITTECLGLQICVSIGYEIDGEKFWADFPELKEIGDSACDTAEELVTWIEAYHKQRNEIGFYEVVFQNNISKTVFVQTVVGSKPQVEYWAETDDSCKLSTVRDVRRVFDGHINISDVKILNGE